MSLAAGTRIGPYEIATLIGEGGMGQVYRATDTNLKRDVAIKILPEPVATSAERLARFQREAELLAALNHPNIAHIYGIEKSESTTALVLEFIDGPTLADRIGQGALASDDALRIARQIAEALEAAHEHGIIHRDLKPANIKLRGDGTVKLLDFGLAKALDPASATAGNATISPTISVQATQAGMILGTAAYMAPEQARGRPVDKRADIWAFGVVLFEMITGSRPFSGDDISMTLASIMMKDPDWTALPAGTHPSVRPLLGRCLKKDPRMRLRDIGEARLLLDEVLAGHSDDAPATARSAATRAAGTPLWFAASLVLATAGLSVFVTWRSIRPAPAPPGEVVRFTMPISDDMPVLAPERDVVIAPDGRYLVFEYRNDKDITELAVRRFDQVNTVPLRGSTGARWPFVSPDSQWVGFGVSGSTVSTQGTSELRKVPLGGGLAVTLCRVKGALTGAAWSSDGTIVFATSDLASGLWSVPAVGGDPKEITKIDASHDERDHILPSILPDGRAVIFTITSMRDTENTQIAVLDLRTGRTKTLIRAAHQGEYVDSGHLIFAQGGTLRAVRFDPDALEVVGEAVPVAEDVHTKTGQLTTDFTVSPTGTLTYVVAATVARATERTLAWVNRSGREEAIPVPPRAYVSARLSPDGTRIALDARDDHNDIWIWDLARQTLQRLTTDPGYNRSPTWTPDGKRVAFTATRNGIEQVHWQAFDGSGAMEPLSTDTRAPELPLSFTPDGANLIFKTPFGTPSDLGVISLRAERKRTMILQSLADEGNGVVSPDGRWLAYNSDESGHDEVYVRPFPNVDTARTQVSARGGTRPLWSRDGRELFYYVAPDMIMTVPVRLGHEIAFGRSQTAVKGPYAVAVVPGRHYDVSSDGQRFLLLKDAAGSAGQKPSPPQIRVVLHWSEELKRLLPAK